MLKIIPAPNPILSQSAKRISKVDSHIRKIIGEMEKALLSAKDPVGVGLAAPQVGKSLQIFIAKPTLKSKIQVFINPKIINKGVEPEEGLPTPLRSSSFEGRAALELAGLPAEASAKAGGRLATGPQTKKEKGSTKLEGCLSLPNIWGEVKRKPSIKVSYMDEKDKKYSKRFNGFLATIIQHEVDHLNGTLFPERVLEQKGTLYKSSKNEKGEDVFEEIEL